MTVAAVLVAYAACLGTLGSRLLGQARWTVRAPLLAIVTYLAAGWSVIAALGLAGVTLAVHATVLGGGLSDLIGACVHRLQATYGTPGGATVAGLGLTLAGAVAVRTVLTATAQLRAAGRQALRHAQTARLVGHPGRPWGPSWWSIPSPLPTASPLSQAYNNWIHEFCQYSPNQLKFAAMLPLHDVNLACQELVRCVRELGAVASFIRPNLLNGHYWHSNYWDPLYNLHEELDVAWCFHEGTGAWSSHMNELYGENRFYRHVASHWIEMQQALIAQIISGVFEFHPKLRVGYLEAQNSWVPGLLSRIEWDYANYRDSHAPYLSLTPKEYFQRNCWAGVEGSEPEIASTASLIGADHMCISTDYPHFDSNFPNVSSNLLQNVPREMAAKIFLGGAGLYAFKEEDFSKAAGTQFDGQAVRAVG